MQIVRADEMGMCFGVRDALAVLDRIEAPASVTIHGELVHNGDVLAALDRRGFHQTPERARTVPATPAVLITAHGISDRERRRLRAADKQLIDTTCPLVRRAHEAAQALQAEGRRVVVIGRRDHVEVRGLVEDLRDPIVVGEAGEVTSWPEARLGVISQTTTQVGRAEAIVAAIRAANPHADVRVVDTICSPTKARVAAVDALLARVDALVVVGGRDSNNTNQLVARGRAAGVATVHVGAAAELDAGWFVGRRVVGLTAGTSTPDATIDAVHARLRAIAATAAAARPAVAGPPGAAPAPRAPQRTP
ncbi:MAG: 4-hydroxy-3-methylbut-2-enyl diphosphate reductase [Planctomycetes bacterium]|nr:4-hydroxy-3-methylbut-2-enyl diphosphate reductase [Planctomycetota bacterium]